MYKRACEILRSVDEAARETALLARAENRTLHIGLSHLYQNYFEDLILAIHARNQNIQIGVSISDSSHLELLLRNGLIDIALIQRPEHLEGFDCISFAPIKLVAVANNALLAPGQTGGQLTLAELARWPLVLLKRAEGLGTFDLLQARMRHADIQPDVRMYATQPEAILHWLQAGMSAATLLPESELRGRDLSHCTRFEVQPAIDAFYPSIVKLTVASYLKEVMELVEDGYPFAKQAAQG